MSHYIRTKRTAAVLCHVVHFVSYELPSAIYVTTVTKFSCKELATDSRTSDGIP